MDVYTCITESLCCTAEIITLQINYTSIKTLKKKTLKWKKKKRINKKIVWLLSMQFSIHLPIES